MKKYTIRLVPMLSGKSYEICTTNWLFIAHLRILFARKPSKHWMFVLFKRGHGILGIYN